MFSPFCFPVILTRNFLFFEQEKCSTGSVSAMALSLRNCEREPHAKTRRREERGVPGFQNLRVLFRIHGALELARLL